MRAVEVEAWLLAQGCNAASFGVRQHRDEALCLLQRGALWVIVFRERGEDSRPFFASDSEEAACQEFCARVLKDPMTRMHAVGLYADDESAREMEARLRGIGVEPIRNDIAAYRGPNDPLYRVFVFGTDIFAARRALGNVPIDTRS